MTKSWKTKELEALAEAFLTCETVEDAENFLRDLLTEAEVKEFAGRLAAATSLSEGKSQRVTARETNVSIATVTRVNKWLKKGKGGYQAVLEKLSKHHHTN